MKPIRFSSLLTALIAGVLIFSFCTCNKKGSAPVVGQCPPTVTYSGQTYNTVLIGEQCWLRRNLNIGIRIHHSQLQDPTNSLIEKYCAGDYESNCDIYGGLYKFDEMMNNSILPGARGICPEGWHIPSDEEWKILIDFLGGWEVAGGKMKETDTIYWMPPNGGGTNSSGFTALPGGYTDYYYNGRYLGAHGFFWSSTESDRNYAVTYDLNKSNAKIRWSEDPQGKACSIRCLKD